MAYDQRIVTSQEFPFEAHSTDRVLRSETALNRQQIVAIRELDRLQADRKRDTALAGPHEPETNDTVAEVEPSTLSNPEQGEAPADKGIDESDPNFVAGEGSTAPDSDGTAPIENAGTKPPADGSGRDTGLPSPNTSEGLKPEESGPNLPQENDTAGTNPDDTVDLLERLVGEVVPGKI